MPGSDLVPVEEKSSALTSSPSIELVSLERERDIQKERQQRSEGVTKGLVRAEVSRLTRSKRRANFLAWLGGGAGVATLALRGTGSTAEEFIGFPWVAWVLAISVVIGVTCAVASFAISDQISRIEQAIEDAAETMSSRSTFLDLLYEITEAASIENHTAWTRGELAEAVSLWSRANSKGTEWDRDSKDVPGFLRIAMFPFFALRRIARWSVTGRFDPTPSLADLSQVIGPKGFVRLLIAKGEETRILIVEEEFVDERLLVRHRLVLADTRKD